MKKFCKVCEEEAIMRMQTTEYEDWFCRKHYGEAMEVCLLNNALRILGEGKDV